MSAVLDLTAGVEICNDAVSRATDAGADDAEISHSTQDLFEINHETAEIQLVRTVVTDGISVAVYVDGAKGTSSTTGRSRDDVDRAIADALQAARSGVADPANVIAPGEPSDLVEVGDREPDRDAMMLAVTALLERLAAEYPKIRYGDSSRYLFANTWSSFANSAGVTRQERRGGYRVSAVFTGKDGERTTSMNGSGAASVSPIEDLLEVGTIHRLLDETVASFDPLPVPETFDGDVIFTPDSLDTLIGPVLGACGGMALMRGTSVFADSQGDQIASPLLTVTSEPLSPEYPLASGFDGHGIAANDLTVIGEGVLRDFLIGWYTSKKLGRPMTAGVTATTVAPGTSSYEELVAGTERGIVLGRFSGGRPTENLDFSGVAKNSFYVEDGRIVGPIHETMLAGNFRDLLAGIRGISAETVNYGSSSYPYLATSGATISTK